MPNAAGTPDVPRPMAKRSARRARPSSRTDAPARRGTATMPFDTANYRYLLGAIGLIVVGYVLMLIDNATGDAVDSAMSLFVAPLLLLAGYLGVAWAVLHGAPGLRAADDAADEA